MKPLSMNETLAAVAKLQRAFRLDGDRLVLTASPADCRATVPPLLAVSIAHHKPAIVAMLSNPLVVAACQAFAVDRAQPLSTADAAKAFESQCFDKRKYWVRSGISAPTSTAASKGVIEHASPDSSSAKNG